MVAVVSTKSDFEAALKHDGLVVVDFFATWCGPCKMIAPLLEKFSKEYTAAKFIKVDVEELSEVAQEYEISSMPTVLFFKNGQIVGKVIGANPAALKQALATNA
ncbi:CIC11C00000002641 [Sungouiella intermedia]|uniref:Thioredoxin n=1 Tax=Sungouiella intermedia TaxID=45354 RepID=A0A1L0CX13_9ASCO|nr:CIC11C00000002109 [[Candida] intermedia]SGZ52150.1 CIC11C00000002641 [[Candida] intermedia]